MNALRKLHSITRMSPTLLQIKKEQHHYIICCVMGSLQQSELQYPETPHEQLSTTFTEGQTRQNIEFVVPMYVEYCLHRLCQ